MVVNARKSNNLGMNYIEVLKNGTIIKINEVSYSKEFFLWKGSYDGILHYKDGSSTEVKISYYGNLFRIDSDKEGVYRYNQDELNIDK